MSLFNKFFGLKAKQDENTDTEKLKIFASNIKTISDSNEFQSSCINKGNPIKSSLLGVAVGDALGVPVEFLSRDEIAENPVTDMMGYGTHNQPAGTFSDDASLTFCLAEALVNGLDLHATAKNFIKWYYEAYWTAHGNVFDIGIATRQAIDRLARGEEPELAGGFEISSNGNGSLMRILPLLFYTKDKPVEERYEITKRVSSITHGHIRSVIACFYYLEFARQLLRGDDLIYIYSLLKIEIGDFFKSKEVNKDEVAIFDRLLKEDIYKLSEDKIQSSGYVVHTLEASIWCLMTTGDYKDAVLKAVNLGDDTDTTGAVTGGLAGLLYGFEDIPERWLQTLARRNDIENLSKSLVRGLKMQNADLITELKFFTTEERGIKKPLHTDNWIFMKVPFDDGVFGGKQYFIDAEFVNPGETIYAVTKILAVDFFVGKLKEGMEFSLLENGIRVIGTGVIKEILNQDLKTVV